MSQKTPKEHLLTAEEIANGPELALSHPLNREKSEVHIRPLGARVGLARTQVSMGRIPPARNRLFSIAIWPTRNGSTFCLAAVKQRSETKPLLCPLAASWDSPRRLWDTA